MVKLFPYKKIRAISFDGDGTLWDFESAMKRGLKEVLKLLKAWFPLKSSTITIETLIKTRNEVSKRENGKSMSHAEIRVESFKKILEDIGEYTEERLTIMKNTYFETRFRAVEVYSDTVKVIKLLKTKYKVGILSNGNTYPDKVGLNGLFDFSLYAEDIGISKPNPQIFLTLLQKIRVKPEELLHVGDSIEYDILPAQKLGIHAIFINRTNDELSHVPDSITVIKNLNELIDIFHL